VCVGAGFAQPRATGTLQGTVKDQTGAVLVDAAVTVSGKSGERRTKTDGQGVYSVDQLVPGKYAVTVSAPGFPLFGKSVSIGAQETATLDVMLRVGVSMSVQVTEPDGLSLDPRKNKSALVLSGTMLNSLPDDPRLMLKRLLAMAGSTGRRGDVAVFVDGFRDFKRLPPKDTIEMIRINSNPFSAEFAQPGAARIEITTKPGSDRYHGQVRAQARSSALDARNALAETKEPSEYRNINGYLQGPVKKDRIGFMLYGGHWFQDENAVIRATVLDPSSLQATGFSATVPTPSRTNSLLAKIDLSVFGQAINASFSRTTEKARGQGLGSGLDLPEHAFESRNVDSVGRLWWTKIGSSSLSDFRVEYAHSEDSTTPSSVSPAVLVLDAFSAGGNPGAGAQATTWATQGTATVTLLRGDHTFKTGVMWQSDRRTNVDRAGFNGTFTFGADVERNAQGLPVLDAAGLTTSIAPLEVYRRTLLGIPGYRPSQFSIVTGDPSASVHQWNLGWFVLDDWSLSERVSLSYGLRQDAQTHVTWRPNFAPRVALSWLLDDEGDNALKFGAGVFYDTIDAGITLDTRRGGARQRFIVRKPASFPAMVSPEELDADAVVSAALYTKSPDLRVPRSIVASASFERQLPLGLFGVVEYQFVKGSRLLRLRDLAVSAGRDAEPAAPLLQFESTGRSLQHELMLGLRLDANDRMSFYANYRVGTHRSDTDGAYTIPSNSLDLASDFGASDGDRRHEIVAGVTAMLPRGVTVDASLTVASGQPFDITTGRDDNGDSYFSDRPAFARPEDPGAVVTPFGTFNPNPGPGDVIVPRNFGREPWQTNLDLSVSKTLFGRLTVGAFAQNVLNTTNLVRYSGVLTSKAFGTPRQALNARRFELTLTVGF